MGEGWFGFRRCAVSITSCYWLVAWRGEKPGTESPGGQHRLETGKARLRSGNGGAPRVPITQVPQGEKLPVQVDRLR